MGKIKSIFIWAGLILFWIITSPLWFAIAIFARPIRFSAYTPRLQRSPSAKR